MKTKIKINTGDLILLSGLPGVGKSTFLSKNKISESMVVSLDTIRTTYFGNIKSYDTVGYFETPSYVNEELVIDIAKKVVESRMKEGLTTFVDATLPNDNSRKMFASIADKYKNKTSVFIFSEDINVIKQRNRNRTNRVPDSVYDSMVIDNTSVYDFNIVNSDTKIEFCLNSLANERVDVIGDTDGIKSETIKFITEDLGYYLNEKGVLCHKKDRKILFLGDFVDRSPESVEMLLFVKKQVENGHYAIAGNHENKLINFCRSLTNNKPHVSSVSSAMTAMDYMKLKEDEKVQVLNFLLSLPSYYVYKNLAFVHANITYFNPLETPRSFMLYGDAKKGRTRNKNSDLHYHIGKKEGLNKYFLVRGHNELTNKQNSVISLDGAASFENGVLKSVKVESLLKSIDEDNMINDDKIKSFNVSFNFKKYVDDNLSYHNRIKNLEKEKLAFYNTDDEQLLKVYKYSKNVFFKKKWIGNPDLLECRGVVFDLAGNIIQYPFDKVFNYSEPNEKNEPTGKDIKDDDKVQVVEKLNGFLGLITLHPFHNRLLFSTTGSLKSNFVDYIEDVVRKDSHYSDLMSYFCKNKDVTLMFEVLHKDDPHIIEYKDEDLGLYLIGARKKKEGSQLFSEAQLDVLAEKLNLKRPKHFLMSFKDAKNLTKNSKIEGYMIIDPKKGKVLCKFKTPYYLITKFLGRLSNKNLVNLYKNPSNFKSKIDEEFYSIVDYLVDKYTIEEFSNFSEQERLDLLRCFINSERV